MLPIVSGVVLIRSSTLGEDNNETSNAGKFLTLQNIKVTRYANSHYQSPVSYFVRESLRDGISRVFGSYEEGIVGLDQVLIQPQLKGR